MKLTAEAKKDLRRRWKRIRRKRNKEQKNMKIRKKIRTKTRKRRIYRGERK